MYVVVIIFVIIAKNDIGYCEKVDYHSLSPELTEIQNLLDKNKDVFYNVLDKTPKEMIKELLCGQFKFSLKNFVSSIIKLLFNEVRNNVKILIKLSLVAILSAILQNVKSSFCKDDLGRVSFYACNMVAITILLKCFNNCVLITQNVVDDVNIFSHVVVPISTSLMVSCGDIVRVSAVKPFVLYGISIIVYVIKKVSLPLIYLSTVLEVLNSVTSRVELSKMSKLIKSVAYFVGGFVLTVFIGVVTIKGSTANLIDGITGKTAKYMFGACIPVVGKYLSDIADSVVGSLMLIRSVIGIASVIGIVLVCVMPILKLVAVVFVLKIMEATLEPVVDKKFTQLIGEVTSSISSMIGVVFLSSVIIILSITVLIK